MWNQNSENINKSNKTKDVSVSVAGAASSDEKTTVVATATQSQTQQHHYHHHHPQPTTTATTSSSSKSTGNGKNSIKTSNSGGGSVDTGAGAGGVGESGNNNLGAGHCSTSKDKDSYNSQSENSAFDSGFHSGPQLTEYYDDEHFGGGLEKKQPPPQNQLNIVQGSGNNKKQSNKQQQQQQQSDYLDSGCIDEDFADEDIDLEEKYSKGPSIRTTAASPQQRVSGTTLQQQSDEKMILEKGVDSGVSEWFCKLTLRDPNQQINNLGATNQNNGGNKNNNADGTQNLASWEVYYQQNNEGDTQLHLACMTGYVDVVAALIRMAPHPCLFNIQNDEAQTSLHLAVIYGQPKILRMLLIAGAEPTARDRHGNTPLHLACISGDTQCVKALTIPISASEINEAHRSYGHLSSDKTTSYLECARLPADLEIRNYDGERCVHLAAQGGHIDILRHLVWFGVDINAREGKSGRTPLHIAIECCNELLANFLLEECATINIETPTYAGLTAFQVACVLDNRIMQSHLEKSGAQTLTPPDSDYDSSDIETDLDDSQMYNLFGDPYYFANYNGGGNPINVA